MKLFVLFLMLSASILQVSAQVDENIDFDSWIESIENDEQGPNIVTNEESNDAGTGEAGPTVVCGQSYSETIIDADHKVKLFVEAAIAKMSDGTIYYQVLSKKITVLDSNITDEDETVYITEAGVLHMYVDGYDWNDPNGEGTIYGAESTFNLNSLCN